MTDDIKHKNRPHATLSASGSVRWLNCVGSVKAEKEYKNKNSIFAEEGTLAHELADTCLKTKKNADYFVGKEIDGNVINSEMATYVQQYIDYVLSYETDDCIFYTEERVCFDNFVKGGFGTVDSAILDCKTGICHIFDLKYGKGVEVKAENNTQAQLYALGFYNELKFLNEIKSFQIHIVQPRIKNFDKWSISIKDLLKFGNYANQRSKLALSDNAPRTAGEKQCQFCKAKADCQTLANFVKEVITADFDNLEELENVNINEKLTDKTKRNILDNKKLITDFINSVETSVLDKLTTGQTFKGYKIVEGRSIRKWNDKAEKVLLDELGEKAYKKTLINITQGQKMLSSEKMQELTYKPKGALTLAKESDKRKAVIFDDVKDCFDNVEN